MPANPPDDIYLSRIDTSKWPILDTNVAVSNPIDQPALGSRNHTCRTSSREVLLPAGGSLSAMEATCTSDGIPYDDRLVPVSDGNVSPNRSRRVQNPIRLRYCPSPSLAHEKRTHGYAFQSPLQKTSTEAGTRTHMRLPSPDFESILVALSLGWQINVTAMLVVTYIETHVESGL